MQRIRGQKRKKSSRGQIKLQRLKDSQRAESNFALCFHHIRQVFKLFKHCRLTAVQISDHFNLFFTQLHEFNSGVVDVFTTRFQINQIKAICIHLPLFFIFICWGLLVQIDTLIQHISLLKMDQVCFLFGSRRHFTSNLGFFFISRN